MDRKKKASVGKLAFGGLLGLIVLGGVVVLAFYSFYLDFIIRSQFEARRWALPTRVFSRPLELYTGLELAPDALEQELRMLRYQPNADGPGSFRRRAAGYVLHTRGFLFWDGREEERRVRLDFDGGRIAAIEDLESSGAIDILRLEPVAIASIYPAHQEDRILVKLDEVPQLLIDTLIAVEDRRFYKHLGVDPPAVIRALRVNLKAGETVQGASTLTQQLVRNLFLTSDRNLWRKVNEAIMAVLVELHYSKQEVLQTYINEIYLGQDGDRAIHGFALASQFHFERRMRDLTPDQIALLVAMVKGPSYYSPRRHPKRTLERRNLVLSIMAERGILPPVVARQAQTKPLTVKTRASSGITPFPAFLDLVRLQLATDYREEDLRNEGLVVYTTMDPIVQVRAEQAVKERLTSIEGARKMRANILESAVVATNVDTGEVAAVVGGRDPQYAGYNRALTARRPIGSLIKPIIYLTALSQPREYTLATRIDDGPLAHRLPDRRWWAPENYDRRHHGQVTLNEALVKSYNVSTARLGLRLGVEAVMDNLLRLGLQRRFTLYPSLLLGAGEMSPLEVSQIYQSLAAGGYLAPLTVIREVMDRNGKPLQRYPLRLKQVADPAAVYLVTSAMHEITRNGTAASLKTLLPDLAVAGKTGTTDGLRDSWFAGFSGGHLIVTWVGRDDNKPTGLTGAQGALPVWADVMRNIPTRPLRLTQPENTEWRLIDLYSGLLADERCGRRQWMPFIKASAPHEYAPCAGGYRPPQRDPYDNGEPTEGWRWLKRWSW